MTFSRFASCGLGELGDFKHPSLLFHGENVAALSKSTSFERGFFSQELPSCELASLGSVSHSNIAIGAPVSDNRLNIGKTI